MKKLADYRTQLGFNQQQMATWLGVGRTVYSMAEIGQRSLPTRAYEKLALLARKAAAKKHTVLPAVVQQRQLSLQQKAIEEMNFKATVLERKLNRMRRKFDRLMNLVQSAQLLRSTEKNSFAAKKDNLLAASAEAGIVRQLKTCLPLQQQLLQLEIDSLRWKAEQLAAGQ